ncbi:MAG: polyprenyl synthetase family protein [Deltaproteobacteria bacterium]|jgi:octaprenyl-diphosphate synthase|nr:polyprenyl synthetase family protein [Deltaproteobacteria bacterium]MBT4526776.1 polyprenyl synthetase family protein [Deltaproteobacteria bacterium]
MLPEKKILPLHEILNPINSDLDRVEKLIMENLETDIPLLTQVGQYILQSGGKRVRPALLLFAAKTVGSLNENAYLAANVIEYIHTATLLHDDVVDNADLRRSKKSARSIWGNEASVLVGDYLFTVSFKYISAFKNHDIVEVLSIATTQIARGEILQLTRDNTETTEAEYMEIIFHKTASLIAAAMEIGAIIGGANEAQRLAIYECGKNIGIAFQLIDDGLDYDVGNEKLGKSTGVDLKERKITLPLSHLLKHAKTTDKDKILNILEKDEITNDDVAEVQQLMMEYESLKYTIDQSKYYIGKAIEQLYTLPENEYRNSIEALANFIVYRNQ